MGRSQCNTLLVTPFVQLSRLNDPASPLPCDALGVLPPPPQFQGFEGHVGVEWRPHCSSRSPCVGLSPRGLVRCFYFSSCIWMYFTTKTVTDCILKVGYANPQSPNSNLSAKLLPVLCLCVSKFIYYTVVCSEDAPHHWALYLSCQPSSEKRKHRRRGRK